MIAFQRFQLVISVVIGLLIGGLDMGRMIPANDAINRRLGTPVSQVDLANAANTMNLKLNEPDVALTDYALAIECGLFVYLLYQARNRRRRLATLLALFFLSTGVASLVGGTTHGFFPDGTPGERILWPITMIAIGGSSLALWMLGAILLPSAVIARRLSMAAVAVFFAYCAVVLFVDQTFLVAIVDYLPATLFVLGIFSIRYARRRDPAMAAGILGLLLAFLASYVQQAKIGLDPVYFNYNALYHLIQAFALAMFFLSARQLTLPKLATEEGLASPPAHDSA